MNKNHTHPDADGRARHSVRAALEDYLVNGGLHPTGEQPIDERQLRMCGRKERMADKKAALTQINRFKHSKSRGRHGRPDSLRAYHCDYCNGWHLTKGSK